MSHDPMQPMPSPQGNPSQPLPPPGAAPASARSRFNFGSFWRTLGLPGQTALIAALALPILFGYLPWFSTPDLDHFFDALAQQQSALTINYSGYNTARGVALFFLDSSDSLTFFPELLLISGSVVVLFVTVLLQSVRLLSARTTGALLLFIGGVLLLVELAFLTQVNAIQVNFETNFRASPQFHVPTVYSVLWGFWLSMVASVAMLLIGGYTLLQRRRPAGSVLRSIQDSISARSSLDRVGIIALVGGLALLISFFLPWFSVNITCSGQACFDAAALPESLVVASSASAFRLVGSGFSVYYTVGNFANPLEIFSPAFLWLILLAGIILMVAAICMLQGTLSARTGRWLIVLAAALALLVEVIYLFSAFGAFPLAKQHISGTFFDPHLPRNFPPVPWMLNIATGPAFGFWIGLVATIAAGAGALFIKQPASTIEGAVPAAQSTSSPGGSPIQSQQAVQGPVGSARGVQRLGLPGLAALLVGLAMLVGFFLPWLIAPDFSDPGKLSSSLVEMAAFGQAGSPPTSLASGWQIVNGLLLFDPVAGAGDFGTNYPLHLFPQFWLVLIGGVALLVIAWLFSLKRLPARAAGGLLFGISLVVLLLELGLPLQAQALQTDFAKRVWANFAASGGASNLSPPVLFGVAWGFWLATAVSATGVVIGGFSLLLRKRPAIPLALAGIATQPAQGEPSGQPPAQ